MVEGLTDSDHSRKSQSQRIERKKKANLGEILEAENKMSITGLMTLIL